MLHVCPALLSPSLLCLPAAIVLLLLLILGITAVVYEKSCGPFRTSDKHRRSLDEFPGLTLVRSSFLSNRGQRLAAYTYRHEEAARASDGSSEKKARSVEAESSSPGRLNPRGLVIFAHGFGGGGHINYLDIINQFARRGFTVFTYDATGNDESEGRSCRGLPQGLIDLMYALDTAAQNPEFKGLPVILCGHSWGGYAVANVLNFRPNAAAIIDLAGFCSTPSILRHTGKRMLGRWFYPLSPFAALYELLKFGRYAGTNGVKGLSKSPAKAMIIHSEDDPDVPIELGLGRYEKAFKGDPRVVFKRFQNRGHNLWLTGPRQEDEALFDEIEAFLEQRVLGETSGTP